MATQRGEGKKAWSNILVAVRCRKLLDADIRLGGHQCVEVVDNKLVILQDPQTTAADDYLRINKSKEKRYVFDHAFGEFSDTEQIYHTTTKSMVQGVLKGFNATVFAYGSTGAGKTHTMIGYNNEGTPQHGIMGLTLQDLFCQVAAKRDKCFEIKCSFLEVYNENIRDLLVDKHEYLDLREDPLKGMTVAGISEVNSLSSADEIMQLLKRANKRRTAEPTAANQTSSRSHAVMQVTVEQRERTAAIYKILEIGKLSMIDLAGSERASQTSNRGIRMLEGANINRSLLALGNCITALSDKCCFVPYRDSKLTRLLKDSLGGNCRTVMIANVSPCHLNYEDTHNTLKYANRAKAIRTTIKKNVTNITYDVVQYTNIIHDLRNEISVLKATIAECHGGGNNLGMTGFRNRTGSSFNKEETDMTETFNNSRAPHFTDEISRWEQDVCQNIEERVQLKRSLLDLKHHDAKCLMEKAKLQVQISSWEQQHGAYPMSKICEEENVSSNPNEDMPQSIKEWRKQLAAIVRQLERHQHIKKDLEERLKANSVQGIGLEQMLPETVESKELQQFFSLMYKIQVIEVENMEFEELNQMTDLVIQQKDLEGEKLRLQITLRDQMIEEQNELVKWKFNDKAVADKKVIEGEHGGDGAEGAEKDGNEATEEVGDAGPPFLTKPEGWEEVENPISPRPAANTSTWVPATSSTNDGTNGNTNSNNQAGTFGANQNFNQSHAASGGGLQDSQGYDDNNDNNTVSRMASYDSNTGGYDTGQPQHSYSTVSGQQLPHSYSTASGPAGSQQNSYTSNASGSQSYGSGQQQSYGSGQQPSYNSERSYAPGAKQVDTKEASYSESYTGYQADPYGLGDHNYGGNEGYGGCQQYTSHYSSSQSYSASQNYQQPPNIVVHGPSSHPQNANGGQQHAYQQQYNNQQPRYPQQSQGYQQGYQQQPPHGYQHQPGYNQGQQPPYGSQDGYPQQQQSYSSQQGYQPQAQQQYPQAAYPQQMNPAQQQMNPQQGYLMTPQQQQYAQQQQQQAVNLQQPEPGAPQQQQQHHNSVQSSRKSRILERLGPSRKRHYLPYVESAPERKRSRNKNSLLLRAIKQPAKKPQTAENNFSVQGVQHQQGGQQGIQQPAPPNEPQDSEEQSVFRNHRKKEMLRRIKAQGH